MTRVLLAGGGTAGHVNPLLAVADELVRQGVASKDEILVVGTAEGLEKRLVPSAGYALATTARLPFPRRLDLQAVLFWPRLAFSVLKVMGMIKSHKANIVAGFGGYASAPAYLAAWLTRTPLVVHEANAVPGFANRLGAKFTPYVVTTFSRTRLPGAELLGMPMNRLITHPEKKVGALAARKHFGLAGQTKTLLVTGGSQGSVTMNGTVGMVVPEILALGWQVLHIVGTKNPLPENPLAGYHVLNYCDRMDLAFQAADVVISRAGAASVSEIQLLGLPAIFVPYPIGNGEQEKNAADSLNAGAAVLVADRDFTPQNFRSSVLPLLADDQAIARMKKCAEGLGRPDAAESFVGVMKTALAASVK